MLQLPFSTHKRKNKPNLCYEEKKYISDYLQEVT